MKPSEAEIKRLIGEANEAKERLYQISERLEELGQHRKAKSAMTLVYSIEEWQNRGCRSLKKKGV